MSTTLFTGTLVHVECSTCGVTWGMTRSFIEARKNDQKTFYCPNGDARWYPPGGSEEDKLRKELEASRRYNANANEALRIERAEVELQRRSAAAYKGHLTRMRKRVANGVCPCCTRSFQNVKRHMATQHPEVLAQLEAAQ